MNYFPAILKKGSFQRSQGEKKKKNGEEEAKPARIRAQKQQLFMKIPLLSCSVTQLFWLVTEVFFSSFFMIPYPDYGSRPLGLEILLKILGIPHWKWQFWQAFRTARQSASCFLESKQKEAGFFTNPEKYLGKKNKKLNGHKVCKCRFSFSEGTSTQCKPKDFPYNLQL